LSRRRRRRRRRRRTTTTTTTKTTKPHSDSKAEVKSETEIITKTKTNNIQIGNSKFQFPKPIPNPTNQTQIQNRIDVKSKISDEVIQSRDSNSGISTKLKSLLETTNPYLCLIFQRSMQRALPKCKTAKESSTNYAYLMKARTILSFLNVNTSVANLVEATLLTSCP
jgi:hypothetical protein